MEAEQEKPRSSGEEQGGGTWECSVQEKCRAGHLCMLGTSASLWAAGSKCPVLAHFAGILFWQPVHLNGVTRVNAP